MTASRGVPASAALGGVLSLFLACAALAGPLEVGLAASAKGDYAEAMRLLRPLAGQGSARAESEVAGFYAEGLGVRKNKAEASNWFRKAADQGDARAQDHMGSIYNAGDGVPQDYAEADRWWRLAAGQGYAPAQLNLGINAGLGHGMPQDFGAARDLFSRAAAQGYSQAYFSLATLYATGQGAPVDLETADMWLILTTSAASDEPEPSRSEALRVQAWIEKRMNADEIASAKHRAAEWKPDKRWWGSDGALPASSNYRVVLQHNRTILLFDNADTAMRLDSRACYNAFAGEGIYDKLRHILRKGRNPVLVTERIEGFSGRVHWSANVTGHYFYRGKPLDEYCDRADLVVIRSAR